MLGPAGFSKLVAIKCLHEEFALESEFVAMFLDEARLTSSIHHPNVVASLDVVAEQGQLLVVMEYVHGETLAALLRTSRQTAERAPVPVVIRVMCDALEGLHAAHVASLAGRCLNIVHRDVSPQNIMVGADGNTRVLDFGIAQAAMRSRATATVTATATGTIKGKIAYMSPEQLQNQAVDARTDIFAAGVVLWEALTGKRLFFAPDPRETANLLLNGPIAQPSSLVPSLPSALDRVVLKALAREREQRFESAHAFAEALREAIPEGSRRDVSEWVGRVAKGSLARRLELLETLEASAVHAQAEAVLSVVTGSAPFVVPFPSGDSTGTQGATARAIPTANKTSSGPRWGTIVTAIAGVIAVLIAWAIVTKHPLVLAGPPPTVTAALVPPPVTEPVAAAPSSPPAALAVESVPLAVPSGAPVQRAPNKSRPGVATGARSAPSKSCTPPYRIDAAGVRRVKLECL